MGSGGAAGFDSFAVMVAAQPAAARMALIESYAVGADALALIDGAIQGFEWLAKQTLEQSPERAGMPDELITAHIGAMREVASTRLRQGREAELPGLLDQWWGLIRSYRPPREPLHLSGRIPGPVEEGLEAHDNAERVIRAFAVEVAERGYRATTVDDVIRRGRMSATTFYDVFGGKEEALMGAIDCSRGADLRGGAAAAGTGSRLAAGDAGRLWRDTQLSGIAAGAGATGDGRSLCGRAGGGRTAGRSAGPGDGGWSHAASGWRRRRRRSRRR